MKFHGVVSTLTPGEQWDGTFEIGTFLKNPNELHPNYTQRLPEIPGEQQFMLSSAQRHNTLQIPFNSIVLPFALQ